MPSTRGHVLIIEDEALTALEIETRLRDIGFESFATADAPNLALERAATRRPDLITADFHLREGTGVEAVGAITASVGAVAVIYITASPDLLPPDNPWPSIAKPLSTHAVATACGQAQAALVAAAERAAPERMRSVDGPLQPGLDDLHCGHHGQQQA